MENKNGEVLNSGFDALDRKIKGLRGSDLIVLASRPSMGKTALALNIVANIVLAKKPKPALIFSLELDRHRLMQRLIASEAEVGLKSIRTGFFQRARWSDLTNAAARFSEAPLYINDARIVPSAGDAEELFPIAPDDAEKIAPQSRDVVHETVDKIEQLYHGRTKLDRRKDEERSPCMTVSHIRTISRRLMTQLRKENEKLGVIVVDSVQLIRGVPHGKTRRHELSKISRSLKRLARDLNVAVIVLSQVGRTAEGKGRPDARPQMSDLHESGALGEYADVLAFIYRDDYYYPTKHDLAGCAEIIVAKNSRGGTGIVKMKFNRNHIKFSSFN